MITLERCRLVFFCSILMVFIIIVSRAASALPIFAHRYGFSCQQCHSTVPRLNDFGQDFRVNGFRLPYKRNPVLPLAVKVNLAYASAPDVTGLPKAIVEEVELLSGGSIGRSASYLIEQYVIDGGRSGLPRDAWLQFTKVASQDSKGFAGVRIGQFGLPMPVDVESERETLAHYTLYDQTVGSNTFNFFDPRIGVDASIGNQASGIEAHAVATESYDRQTTTPRSGVDWMLAVSENRQNFGVNLYRYQGQRKLHPTEDRFWRQGYAAYLRCGPMSLTGLMQTGDDSSADGSGMHVRSGGGFLESAYRFNDAFSAVARYERFHTQLEASGELLVLSAILRPRRNMRLTIEDAVKAGHHNLNTALLFAY